MACPIKSRYEISAYHDGELSPEDARRLEGHLAQCAVCARELDELRRLSRVLAGAAAPDAPATVIERLYRVVIIQREEAVITLAKRLIAAAAAILIACTTWIWGVGAGSNTSAATENSWEWTAVTLSVESPGDARQIAQLFADDLSTENPHD